MHSADLTTKVSKFKNFKDTFFPIETWELKKFVPLALMMMLTIFVYSMLRSAKDTILIPELGAEMISTVKLFGVLPAAILFLFIYAKVSSVFSRESLYYGFAAFFGLFFLSYAYILYPNRASLQLDLGSNGFELGFIKYPLKIVENWVFCSFYILSELWGNIMLSLLFWQFANFITPVTQAKRFYSLIGLVGQFGLIAAGQLTSFISRMIKDVNSPELAWRTTQDYLIWTVVVAVAMLIVIYWWMNKFVLTDKKHYDPELMQASGPARKKKTKLSMMESFKYIFSSKYIGYIAILVISYGISINLVEGVWKSSLKLQYPLQNDYSAFMGSYLTWTGIATAISMLIGVNVLRKFSWFTGAIFTPLMLGVTGVIFFVVFMFRNEIEPFFSSFGISALMIAVIFGTVQNVLSKSTKYSLFDPTKEMAYIPLDDELKMKGKAAVDVVGSRLGKSGGAAIQFLLISVTGFGINDLAGVFFVIFSVIIALWAFGVHALSIEFEKKVAK